MAGIEAIRDLLSGPAPIIAPRLLGAELSYGQVTIRITEVEAYAGADDPGSHAWRGRTPRNTPMFAAGGQVYVYFTYGMHHCVNLVCGPVGEPSAVLIRAGEVIAGIDAARSRRGGVPEWKLASGPGNLTKSMGIDKSLHGTALQAVGDPDAGRLLVLIPADEHLPEAISQGVRIGLSRGQELPWRWWLSDDPTVSQKPRKSRRQ